MSRPGMRHRCLESEAPRPAAGGRRPPWHRVLACFVAMAAITGCRPGAPREAFPSAEHDTPALAHPEPTDVHGPEGHLVLGIPDTVADFRVEAELRSIRSEEVVDFLGPRGDPFQVALRTPQVGHYPCTSCHIRPIGSKAVALDQMHSVRPEHTGATAIECAGCHDPRRPGGMTLDCTECHEREGERELMPSRSAHLTVELSHPSGDYRNCLTCHAPGNPGLLALRDGRFATLDQAYRLCAGCHFMEADDWAGGSHGKRLAGWAGARTVLSCTGCHDPHDPTFPVRRPVTFPKIARPEGAR